ncbi:unnamed protein product [Anisakis simplex]|uniref:Uncharacterized protein n=1 Tax=Anisakis simplex TaxID=6269 RepID=A0A0M3JQG4_ANISI|nr:unnamed protein product [Anisakis simplex]
MFLISSATPDVTATPMSNEPSHEEMMGTEQESYYYNDLDRKYWRRRSGPCAQHHLRLGIYGSFPRSKSVSLRSALSMIQPMPIGEGIFWLKLGWSYC